MDRATMHDCSVLHFLAEARHARAFAQWKRTEEESMLRRSRCEFCGNQSSTLDVHYRQNTGALVMRYSKEWHGRACRDCSTSVFKKASLHTLVLGWWGTISF